MKLTKVFKSGNSQAVRLPKNFQFKSSKVEILRRGKEIVLREVPKNLAAALESLPQAPDDFFSDTIKDTLPQKRDF